MLLALLFTGVILSVAILATGGEDENGRFDLTIIGLAASTIAGLPIAYQLRVRERQAALLHVINLELNGSSFDAGKMARGASESALGEP